MHALGWWSSLPPARVSGYLLAVQALVTVWIACAHLLARHACRQPRHPAMMAALATDALGAAIRGACAVLGPSWRACMTASSATGALAITFFLCAYSAAADSVGLVASRRRGMGVVFATSAVAAAIFSGWVATVGVLAILTAVAAVAERRVGLRLGDLPQTPADLLGARMRLSVGLTAVSVCAAVGQLLGAAAAGLGVHMVALNCAAVARVGLLTLSAAPDTDRSPRRSAHHSRRAGRRSSDVLPASSHLLLGVSVSFLRAFVVDHGIKPTDSTADVAAIVAKLTNGGEMALVEHCRRNSTGPPGVPAVARATHFVSHAQSCSFTDLVDAVGRHAVEQGLADDDAFFWIDVFSIRGRSVSSSVRHIGEILAKVGEVIVVVDAQLECLRRIWVLMEVLQSELHGVALSTALCPGATSVMLDAGMDRFLSTVDVATAESGRPEDHTAIIDHLSSEYSLRGDRAEVLAKLNTSARAKLRGALAGAGWQAFHAAY